jgi:hypothetical protein
MVPRVMLCYVFSPSALLCMLYAQDYAGGALSVYTLLRSDNSLLLPPVYGRANIVVHVFLVVGTAVKQINTSLTGLG